MPAPVAAETILTGEAGAASTKQPELHWWVGAVPVVPFWAVKPALVLLSVIEFWASVWPLVTYPAGSPEQLACVQYCLKTELLLALLSPLTVRFQPAPLPVASSTPKAFIVALSVCAWPFSVRAGRFGTSGAVVNARLPGVTENWVVSLDVAAKAGDAVASIVAAAATATIARVACRDRIEVLHDLRCGAPVRGDPVGTWPSTGIGVSTKYLRALDTCPTAFKSGEPLPILTRACAWMR